MNRILRLLTFGGVNLFFSALRLTSIVRDQGLRKGALSFALLRGNPLLFSLTVSSLFFAKEVARGSGAGPVRACIGVGPTQRSARRTMSRSKRQSSPKQIV